MGYAFRTELFKAIIHGIDQPTSSKLGYLFKMVP